MFKICFIRNYRDLVIDVTVLMYNTFLRHDVWANNGSFHLYILSLLHCINNLSGKYSNS